VFPVIVVAQQEKGGGAALGDPGTLRGPRHGGRGGGRRVLQGVFPAVTVLPRGILVTFT